MQQNIEVKFSLVKEKYWAGWEGGGGQKSATGPAPPRLSLQVLNNREFFLTVPKISVNFLNCPFLPRIVISVIEKMVMNC